eukprot:8151126-Pyramimonas_sp.AAC.1
MWSRLSAPDVLFLPASDAGSWRAATLGRTWSVKILPGCAAALTRAKSTLRLCPIELPEPA